MKTFIRLMVLMYGLWLNPMAWAVAEDTCGTDWQWVSPEPQSNGNGYSFNAIAWNGNLFLALGSFQYGSYFPEMPPENNLILTSTSPDGITWSLQNLDIYAPLLNEVVSAVVWDGRKFVAVGYGNASLISGDGITWAQYKLNIDGYDFLALNGITWDGRKLVAVGNGGIILTSPDGVIWSQQHPPLDIDNKINAITWNGNQFVAVGNGGIILTSLDGVTWQQHLPLDILYNLNAITWNSNRFVVVGEQGIILTSPDGVAWSQQNSGTLGILADITWNGSQFVAVGSIADYPSNIILTSADGITWQKQGSGVTHALGAITWGNNQFVVAGNNTIISSTCSEPRYRRTLETPHQNASESGIGLIRGWACQANRIEIQIDDYPRIQAAYGTSRKDTASICGDDNNGFGLTFNWNLLGDGPHTLKAFADGAEFGHVAFQVATLGEKFLTPTNTHYPITDFPPNNPQPFDLVWSPSQQNFVISQPNGAENPNGLSGDSTHQLENPPLGGLVSGIGLISGWVCQASAVTIEIDDYPAIPAAHGTNRRDTLANCGDDNNGFGLTFNWNLLGDGPHSVRALADGVVFAKTTVRVATLGAPFLTGISGAYDLPDFPLVGNTTLVRWSQAHQNFVITGKQ